MRAIWACIAGPKRFGIPSEWDAKNRWGAMQTEQLLIALKKRMRQRGVSYSDAGKALGLSSSSVKRLFSEKSFTLPRIEVLCQLTDIDLYQLADLAQNMEEQLDSLSVEQESALVSDPKVMLIGVCLINRWSFKQILEKYDLLETELVKIFAVFDRMKIIEYLPGNRYRLNISRNFTWIPNGPIQRFFVNSLADDVIKTNISTDRNHLYFKWAMISTETAIELNKKISQLIDEYLALSEYDSKYSVQDKLTSSLMICFQEDWEPEMFSRFIKQ